MLMTRSTDTETDPDSSNKGVDTMLYWAFVFLVVALIAGFLGFGGLAGLSMEFAKILFVIFLVLFVISLVFGSRRV